MAKYTVTKKTKNSFEVKNNYIVSGTAEKDRQKDKDWKTMSSADKDLLLKAALQILGLLDDSGKVI